MADVNPDDQKPVANPAGSDENKADDQENKGSDTPPNADEGNTDAMRKLQSERDQYKARLEKLEGTVFGDQVEKTMKQFLSESDKYPDVVAEDLVNAESLDPKHLEAEAKKVQDRFDKARNKALVDAQNTPPDAMTEQEQQNALEELKKKPDKTIGDYFRIKLAPRK